MKILLADHDKNRLDVLYGYIAEIFPEGEITAEPDSLMAGKICFYEAFDIAFADLDDRRLDGLKMRDFVRRSNPKARFYLCGSPRDLYEWDVIDEDGNVCEDGIDGVVPYPVTKDKLLKVMNLSGSLSPPGRTYGTELDDCLLQQAAGGSGINEIHSESEIFNIDKMKEI
ncbi:MAG: hypothetical protein ACI4XA_10965 [Oscillospiraceae bacterium]